MKKDNKAKGKKSVDEPDEQPDLGPHIFDVLKENVVKNHIIEEKRDKAFLIDYTIAILKPSVIAQSKNCKTIIERIEKENLEVFDIKIKFLKKEEIINLYFKHTQKDYFVDILKYMQCGPVAILVLINKTDSFLDTNGIKTLYKSPIYRWKEIIGEKDPAIAKTQNPNSLRTQFGQTIIKNEFWGSDNPTDAYRELLIFQFPTPAKPPVFKFDINKIDKQTIFNFLFPEKPNHPDVVGRLDIFGKYGPITNYHIVDICICQDCRQSIKDELIKEGNKLKTEKDKILSDDFIDRHKQKLCGDCTKHIKIWSHIYAGKEQTHILTNQEIDFLVIEMNKEDLLEILRAEKGSSANTCLAKIDIKKYPKELEYTKQHIEKLIRNVPTDYYDRYDFDDLQKVILEDRRIRNNFWVSKIIGKPVDSFKNPNLINNHDESESNNIKGKNFTILRKEPVKVNNEEEIRLKSLIIKHPMFTKNRLTGHEINNKVNKLLSTNYFKTQELGSKDKEAKVSNNVVSNMVLLRDYELETLKTKKLENLKEQDDEEEF